MCCLHTCTNKDLERVGCTAVKVQQPEKGARHGSLQVHASRSMRDKRVLSTSVAFIHAQIIGIRKGWDAQLSRRNSQNKEREADRSKCTQVGLCVKDVC